MARSVTERGFVTYDVFEDSGGSRITVRQSSAATEPKVWLFHAHTTDLMAMPHLNREQATRLRDALDEFLKETS